MSNLEITAKWMGEKYRFGSTVIGLCLLDTDSMKLASSRGHECKEMSFKGPYSNIEYGKTYRFYGRWKPYQNRRTGQVETQFEFDTFVPFVEQTMDGIVSYLVKHGTGLGIGKSTAKKIFETFGCDSIRTIRENPKILRSFSSKIEEWQCDEIARSLESVASIEAATIDLMKLFSGRRFPKTTIGSVIQKWGNRASEEIRRDPYKLMEFDGIGFKLADRLYCDLGLRQSRIRRQLYFIWNKLSSDSDGHVWHPEVACLKAIRDEFGSLEKSERAIELGRKFHLAHKSESSRAISGLDRCFSTGSTGLLSPNGSFHWIASGEDASIESELADCIASAMDDGLSINDGFGWPDVDCIEDLTDHQKQKLRLALAGPLAILGGRPGTGKTFTVAQLLKKMIDLGIVRLDEIVVGAPTGKAAVRLTAVMDAAGLPIRARTWHSLIIQARHDDGYFDCRLLVGDEMSMCDQELLLNVLRSMPRYCHFLVVGDVNQLPPVGRGAPLRDMIAAGVPYGELTKIERNSGGIVEACGAIVDGRKWSPGDNLLMIETDDPNESIEKIEKIIDRLPEDTDRIWDCQVLIAVNSKSQLAKDALNQHLQKVLNNRKESSHSLFRVGDKVVNTKNDSYRDIEANDGTEYYVANGEQGKITSIDRSVLTIELQNPYRLIGVPFGNAKEDGSGNGCNWDLGYAISCHKSQGSEWPYVIVVIDDYPGAKAVCSREWMNTAISRARLKCFLVGKKSVADGFCRKKSIGLRKTFLAERIGIRMASSLLEAI